MSEIFKKCPNCGGKNDEGNVFCDYCGCRIELSDAIPITEKPSDAIDPRPKAPFGTPSLVCSIIGLALIMLDMTIAQFDEESFELLMGMLFYAGIGLSILGLVLGAIGLKKVKGSFDAYSDAAKLIVGMVLGIVGIVSWSMLMLIGTIAILEEEGLEGFI